MAERALGAARARRASALAPGLFVLLWSTGFIGAKLGVPYAEPFTFLSLRFAIVLLLMLPLAIILRAQWPGTLREGAHIAVAGVLIQGGYLAGCFAAVYHGMPAGVIALVVGLQPIVTAFAAAPLLGERVTRLQWVGLLLGFSGVVLVMWPKLQLHELDGVSVAWSALSLFSITAGTLYQKRYCSSFDLRAGSVIQFTAALLLLLPVALLTERMNVEWTGEFIFALAWLVFVLSIGAISLLFYLIEHGEATRVASLFYLTPLTTAAMAYFIFGERLSLLALIGMVIGIIGVALVIRKPGLATPEP
ncbi:MAG TPA: DMT family transporter [Burkholderiales bacterium]|nr:DMT family transporter [Burkholderiales bacterium]